MKTIRDIISKNWRRQQFDFANSELIKKLKFDLLDFVKDAFYDPKNNKLFLTETDQKNLQAIFYWLIGNCNPVLYNKAPIITGSWGTGKSVALKGMLAFINKHYSHDAMFGGISNPIYILSQDLANAFKINDTVLIAKLKTCSIIGIDDLGYEAERVNYFGTECKPFEEIIMSRYDARKTTIITTNLKMNDIGERYGWHVHDRIRQMSFLIEWFGDSKRK